jgi:hypothetical protein
MILFMIGDEWHGSCIRSDVRVSPPHPRLDCVTAVSSDHPWPGGSDAGWTAPEGVRRADCRGPCPWFGPAAQIGAPQPRARAAELGEGERRSRPGGARGAGWGWNETQHHKGMAGMGATADARGHAPAARTPQLSRSRKQHGVERAPQCVRSPAPLPDVWAPWTHRGHSDVRMRASIGVEM